MKNIVIVFFIILLIKANKHTVQRQLVCTQRDQKQCKSWSQNINYKRQATRRQSLCFPASTYVLTEEGPKMLSEINNSDKLLAYDKETNKNKYSPLLGWLHRDVQGYLSFTQIKTNQGFSYFASQDHNIGFIEDGAVSFKFASELNNGDELLTLGYGKTLDITETLVAERQKGLFAPFTAEGNFYIFPKQFTTLGEQAPMILVHCLAGVQNPAFFEGVVSGIMSGLNIFGVGNQQSVDSKENYIHPVSHLLSIFLKERHQRYDSGLYDNYYRADEHQDNIEKYVINIVLNEMNAIIRLSP